MKYVSRNAAFIVVSVATIIAAQASKEAKYDPPEPNRWDAYQDFGRLEEFVGFLAKVHAAGIVSELKTGIATFDEDRYQALEKEYLKTKSAP